MKSRSLLATGLAAGLGALALAALVDPALAQTPAPEAPAAAAAAAGAPVPNKGDTAWMLVATCLVLMMSVPGLALFYGGSCAPRTCSPS
jgi:Amt family ammonium transporter